MGDTICREDENQSHDENNVNTSNIPTGERERERDPPEDAMTADETT